MNARISPRNKLSAKQIETINAYVKEEVNKAREEDKQNKQGETADVKIMLGQLELIFEPYNFCDYEEHWRSKKLERLEARLKRSDVIDLL